MTRGTTPTHTFTIPEELDVSTLSVIYITYSQFGRRVIEKDIEDIIISDQTLSVTLSQVETLLFRPGEVEIQIRAKTTGGSAYASTIVETTAERILKNGEI